MKCSYELSEIPEKVFPEPYRRYAKVLFDYNDISSTPMSMAYFRFEPGQIGPKHVHENEVEIYITIKGKGQITIGNEVYELKKGNVIYVPPKVEHETINNSNEDLEFFGIFGPGIDMTNIKNLDTV